MKKYHRLLQRQLKKIDLDGDTHTRLLPFLEQINNAYVSFDNDLYQAETTLEKSSQELYLANKQLVSKFDAVSSRLAKVAENIKDVIFEIDLEGNWKYLNPAWEKLFGHKIDDCLGKPFYQYLNTTKGECLKKLLDANKDCSINSGFSNVIHTATATGEKKWVDVSIKGIQTEKGVFEGYIGTIVDISNIKKTEFELVKAKEKAMSASKAKDDFLSTMSHEIRTPLNAVIGISHLLLMENPKPEQLENLQTLKYSSEHLLGLVNDILDFNKITSGALDLEETEFNMTHLLNSIQSIFNNKAKAKNIRFSIKKDNSLPEMLIGDSVRLSQILTNLVGNAIKFTEQGKVTLDLEIITETNDSCLLEVNVKDTGIGIPKEKQKKIFNSFAQANSDTTRKYGGTGLGLAICKQLLEIMGSDLKLESEKGKGATFSFVLQLKKGNSTTSNIHEDDVVLEKIPANEGLNGVKVLIAEDNKINIMVIRKFLIKWGIDFEIAENGKIAVEMAKNSLYDLVLMDLQMPVMNGFDSCKLIKESDDSMNRDTPIYALSASTGADIKNEIKKYKMDGLICKPFDPDKLHQKLKDIVRTRKLDPNKHVA
ncbi:ATP-binding protein [Maribacter sp. 2304DJ31-5]|uniref:PAS domain-containing hybrid sensor histidine kinase/response regulator n=1 Tax=Maribacter sp. 2304DJ31-5 TaxID=3386273 RepID=UPI0039BC8561